jgi:hypothetical protein
MKRAAWFIIGGGLLALAVESLYDLFVAFQGTSQGVELAGPQIMLAVAMVVTGLGLMRQSMLRAPRTAVGTYSLSLFGYGWLLGVFVNDAISLIRNNRPTYDSLWMVALDIFSWLVVTLILAIPGLIAIVLARRL